LPKRAEALYPSRVILLGAGIERLEACSSSGHRIVVYIYVGLSGGLTIIPVGTEHQETEYIGYVRWFSDRPGGGYLFPNLFSGVSGSSDAYAIADALARPS